MDALVVEYDFRRSDGHTVRKKIRAVDREEFRNLVKIIGSDPERYRLVTRLKGGKTK